MQEALFYEKKDGNRVKCTLCPWYCDLTAGQTGVCKVRKNTEGVLETLVFNKVAALGVDPIEKKPLYHFHPGKNILSLGSVGCNLHCTFCQNHNISQCRAEAYDRFIPATSQILVENALSLSNNAGLAFTYNEPFTFYEFMLETAKRSHEAGMKNVVVTNGYVNRAPLENILPFTDAYNIDLKSFDDNFYRKQTRGKSEPVLKAITKVAGSKAHLEITNLVIPGLNDDEQQFEAMVKWIATETGMDTPFHLSRYFPGYKLNLPPTPVEKLERLYQLAKVHLRYVYAGNIDKDLWADTSCPFCGKLLIHRSRYVIQKESSFNGNCPSCGHKIPVIL